MLPSKLIIAILPLAALAQQTEVVAVSPGREARTVELPGELLPYEQVQLHARVSGYVDRVLVDMGSAVRRGQLLASLSAPEIEARIAEAKSRVQAAEAERVQAEAQVAASGSTYERLKKAAETPGAISGNELTLAEKQLEAARALSAARLQARRAADASLRAVEQMQEYQKITAPFDGIITERFADPGALVKADSDPALFVLQKISPLRLEVAVPEQYAGGLPRGTRVKFRVSAFPARTYTGTVARFAHSVDRKTRTAAVQADVPNADRSLAPGMYPQVSWPVRSAVAALSVPRTSVVRTTERTFVIRVRNGRAEWVDVRPGAASGDLIEVVGPLAPGDLVVRRGTDEIREGASIQVKRAG
jgi:RND family efflux transporter MFP subunit